MLKYFHQRKEIGLINHLDENDEYKFTLQVVHTLKRLDNLPLTLDDIKVTYN